MRAVLGSIVVALAVASCGSSSESGDPTGVPELAITSLRTNGLIATIEISATDGGDLLDVEIDWGDDSSDTELRGEGRLSADHAYLPGTDEVTITVEATDDDGNVVSSGQSLDLPDSASTVAAPDSTTTSTTSTVDSSTSTSTTPATTVAPTTTSPPPPPSPPPTTSTTTTTTEPEPVEVVIPLALSDAVIVGDVSDGRAGTLDVAAGTFGVETSTIGISETDFAEIELSWTIDPERFAGVGPDPQLGVLLDTSVSARLTTGDWAGMSSILYMEAFGTYGGVEFGRSEQVISQVGRAGDNRLVDEPFTFGFGAPVEGELAPVQVVLRARCDVSGSTNAFGVLAVSSCDAYDAGRILLGEGRLTVSEPSG